MKQDSSGVEGQDAIGLDGQEQDRIHEMLGSEYELIVQRAEQHAKYELRDLGVFNTFRLYWKPALWSVGISFALVMEGYDVVIINSFYGSNSFINRFGEKAPDGTKVITAPWQTGLSNSALCGEVIGLALNGWASDRFGYKKTYCAAMAMMMITILTPVLAQSLPQLSAGEVLMGIPWGVFQTLTTAYASEICPLSLRQYLTAWVTASWGLGILLSSIVVRATLNMSGNWAWRLPFAIQWIYPVPLFLVGLFAPESPWWFVRKGRVDEAKKSLQRLQTDVSGETQEHIDNHVAFMQHTIALEKLEQAGATYFECFRGVNLRRSEIAAVCFAFQWWCGNPLMSYAVTFFRRAGLSQDNSFTMNIVMNTSYIIGTVSSFFLMRVLGRRSLYLLGAVMCSAHLIVIGALGFSNKVAVSWAIGALLITFALSYNFTLGPVCYTIISEVPSNRLRAKTIVLARLAYVLTGLVTNTLTPRMLSPDAWNWGAKGAFLYLGTCVIVGTWCFFRLPETKGRTYAEIDELFVHKVPARKFKHTEVHLYPADAVATGAAIAAVQAFNDEEEKQSLEGDVRTATLDA